MNGSDDRTIEPLLSSMREILRASGYSTPELRKAAVRRALHQSVVGMTRDEAGRLLAAVESRFPDRVYESSSRAVSLERRTKDLEAELARVTADLEDTKRRARALDQLVEPVVQAAVRAAGEAATAAAASARLLQNPDALRPLFELLTQSLEYVLDQDAVVREFEAPMERAAARSAQSAALRQTLARVLRGDAASAGAAEELQGRLKRLRRFPAALITGLQQSWRSGTTSVLKSLDPTSTAAKPKWHKPGAAIEETRDRFKSFWDQFDLNLDHYYRAAFERIYSEAMEERR